MARAAQAGMSPSIGRRSRKRAAATLDDLDEDASKQVHFIRADARPAARRSTSTSLLKDLFNSGLEPKWSTASAAAMAAAFKHISHRVKTQTTFSRQHLQCLGIHIGRSTVRRRLLSGSLRLILSVREAGPGILSTELGILAAKAGVPLVVLGCSSAQLGQLFGLLRVSAIGFSQNEAEPLLSLLDCAPPDTDPR